MIYKKIQGSWIYILTILSVAYLLFELAFNSRIVDLPIDITDQHFLEILSLEGRFLSGIGCVLILWKLFIKPHKMTALRFISLASVTAVVGFSLMFFGQKVLIDDYIDRSSPEERLNAQYLSLLKQAIGSNAVAFTDVSITSDDIETPGAKTFLATIGFMTFFSDDFIGKLKKHSDLIISKIAESQSYKTLPEYYEGYISAQEQLAQSYENYKNISSTYHQTLLDIDNQSSQQWQNIQAQLLATWQDSKQQQNEANLIALTDQFVLQWDRYRRGIKSCGQDQICLNKVNKKYRSSIRRQFQSDIPPEYWCLDAQTKTVSQRIGTRTIKKTIELPPVCDDLEYAYLKDKIRNQLSYAKTYEEFLSLPKTVQSVRDKVLRNGYTMPENWSLDDKDTFINITTTQEKEKAKAKLAEIMTENFGEVLPLDLNPERFTAHPSVQKKLKEALKLDTAPFIPTNLNAGEFRETILWPDLNEKAQIRKTEFIRTSQDFANGEPKEKEGKAYVRSLIIPPVAMAFSLFFGLLNLITLLADLPGVFIKRLRRFSMAFRSVSFCIIIALPFVMGSFFAQSDAFSYFKNETSKNTSSIIGTTAEWTMNMQPLIYPLGHIFADSMPIAVNVIGLAPSEKD